MHLLRRPPPPEGARPPRAAERRGRPEPRARAAGGAETLPGRLPAPGGHASADACGGETNTSRLFATCRKHVVVVEIMEEKQVVIRFLIFSTNTAACAEAHFDAV